MAGLVRVIDDSAEEYLHGQLRSARQALVYLGETFGRPFPEPLGRWQDADNSDLWVTPGETRAQIIGFYQRAWDHADATIKELAIDAPGHARWWPRPDVKLSTSWSMSWATP